MKRIIWCIILATMLMPTAFAQDDQSVQEPQRKKVEEVSASALEKLEEEKSGTEQTEAEAVPESQQEEEVGEEAAPQKSSTSVSKKSRVKSTVGQDRDDKEDVSSVDDSSAKKKKSSISDKDVATFFKWCLIIIALWVVYKIIKYRYNRKCDNCGKWNSMKVVGKELVDQKSSSITEKRKIRDSQGNTVRSYEVDVPATVYTYHIHRRCKHCGYQDILSKQVKRKN